MSMFSGCFSGCFGCVGALFIVAFMLLIVNVAFATLGFPTWLVCGFSALLVFMVGGASFANLLNSFNR